MSNVVKKKKSIYDMKSIFLFLSNVVIFLFLSNSWMFSVSNFSHLENHFDDSDYSTGLHESHN